MPQSGLPAGSRVLIADDDADIRSLVSTVLTNAGAEAEAVDGGVPALAAAQRQARPVVVLDVRMPDMNGLEVCRQLKAYAPTADCAVLLISADSTADDIAAGYAAGADDYLPKPFSPRELVRRIAMLLQREDLAGNPIAQDGPAA